MDGQVLKCEHCHACGYQAQKEGRPNVWIVAHQMLPHAQSAFGKVERVMIGEGFLQSGLWIPKRGLTIDELRLLIPLGQVETTTWTTTLRPSAQDSPAAFSPSKKGAVSAVSAASTC